MINKKKAFKWSVLVLAVLFLALFLRHIDFQEVYTYIHQVGWGFVLLLMVTGFGYFLGSTAWYLSFRSLELSHPLNKLFVFRMIGETLAVINPTSVIAGDASKIYFLKKLGVPEDEASSATLVARIILVISLVFILIFSSIFFLDSMTFFENVGYKVGILSLMSMAALGLLHLFVSPKMYLYKVVSFILNHFSKSATTQAERIYHINSAMADYFKNYKTKFIFAFVLSVFHWLSGAMEFYVILLLLDIPISLLSAVMLEMGVMVVKSLGAFVPGQIGVEEQGNRLMLALIGVKVAGIWVVVSILRRARQLFWLGMGVFLYLIFYKKQGKSKKFSKSTVMDTLFF